MVGVCCCDRLDATSGNTALVSDRGAGGDRKPRILGVGCYIEIFFSFLFLLFVIDCGKNGKTRTLLRDGLR